MSNPPLLSATRHNREATLLRSVTWPAPTIEATPWRGDLEHEVRRYLEPQPTPQDMTLSAISMGEVGSSPNVWCKENGRRVILVGQAVSASGFSSCSMVGSVSPRERVRTSRPR